MYTLGARTATVDAFTASPPTIQSVDGQFASPRPAAFASTSQATVRPAVVRATAFGSRVIIMDEPTAALGVKESRKVLELMLDVKKRGLPSALVTFEVDGVTFGVATCYDIRFPELFRKLADDGADIVLVPTSWGAGEGKREQWEVLVRARALDSGCWVLGCGQADPATTSTPAAFTFWNREV